MLIYLLFFIQHDYQCAALCEQNISFRDSLINRKIKRLFFNIYIYIYIYIYITVTFEQYKIMKHLIMNVFKHII